MTSVMPGKRKKRSNVGHWREIDRARLLVRRILASQEEQRREISRELHDNIAQVLVAATSRLELAKRRAPSPMLRRELSKVTAELEEMLDSVGKLARQLRPGAIGTLGLTNALTKHAEAFAKRVRLSLDVDIAAPSAGLLDGEQSTNLFRIAQEALANIEHHSKATKASLKLHDGDGHLRLEISDNGRSFTPGHEDEAQADGHLGFTGMRERAAVLDGHLEVEAIPGNGTTIRAIIPLPGHNGNHSKKHHKL